MCTLLGPRHGNLGHLRASDRARSESRGPGSRYQGAEARTGGLDQGGKSTGWRRLSGLIRRRVEGRNTLEKKRKTIDRKEIREQELLR